MANVYEVKAAELVKLASQRLKEKDMKKPAYVDFVKSGPSKERVPHEREFWFVRSASILRQVYLNGPDTGVDFFIDDSPVNVAAAARCGFRAFAFTSAGDLRRELARLELL